MLPVGKVTCRWQWIATTVLVASDLVRVEIWADPTDFCAVRIRKAEVPPAEIDEKPKAATTPLADSPENPEATPEATAVYFSL